MTERLSKMLKSVQRFIIALIASARERLAAIDWAGIGARLNAALRATWRFIRRLLVYMMPVRDWLASALEYRHRLSIKLYAGIGSGVMLTIAACIVGFYSFSQVSNAQETVNDESVPELAASFGVAQFSSQLVAAGPNLVSATTLEEFAAAEADLEENERSLEWHMEALTRRAGDTEQIARVRENADSLKFNLDTVGGQRLELLRLNERRDETITELELLNDTLQDIIIPAIDDQFFYTMTGYRTLEEDEPAPRFEHFTEGEIARYRHLAELVSDSIVAIQQVATALTLSDPSLLEPLRDRFEAAARRIDANLAALEGEPLHAEVSPTLARISELALSESSGFDLIERELRLIAVQEELLARNRQIALDLVGEVDSLVVEITTRAQETTQTAEGAIETGVTLLLAISAISVGGALLIAVLYIGRTLLRRLQRLSDSMRRMAGGDLSEEVEVVGRDEVADMATALEVFRQNSLEAQRLNLVEQLANELQQKNEQLEEVLEELQRAQDQIIVREKLAALGELTAGVAHEIRNPLNFVKNFSEVSEELIEEMNEVLDEDEGDGLDEEQLSLIREIANDINGNLDRIRTHGNRADRIVGDMLMMGSDSSELRHADINALLEEHSRLAYHSARAADPEFQLHVETDFDPNVGEMEVVPQNLGRVFLNMVGNAGDATHQRRTSGDEGGDYMPTLWLRTRREADRVVIGIRDNGGGIPPDVMDKMFNPFFTTKPTDKGTGLGLAISNDIVRQHGGLIRVDTVVGDGTEMVVELPLTPNATLAPEQQLAAEATR